MRRNKDVSIKGNFRKINPLIWILILTHHEDIGYLKMLLEAEAKDYILKQSAPGDLILLIYGRIIFHIFRHISACQKRADDKNGTDYEMKIVIDNTEFELSRNYSEHS